MSRSRAFSIAEDGSSSLSTALSTHNATTRARASSIVEHSLNAPPGLAVPHDTDASAAAQQLVNRRTSISSHSDGHSSLGSLGAPLRAPGEDYDDAHSNSGKTKGKEVSPTTTASHSRAGSEALSTLAYTAAQNLLAPAEPRERERNHHRRTGSTSSPASAAHSVSLRGDAIQAGLRESVPLQNLRAAPVHGALRAVPSARSVRDPFASPNPFASPVISRAPSVHFQQPFGTRTPSALSLSALATPARSVRTARSLVARSTMLQGEPEKPWRGKPDRSARFAYWLTYLVAFLGIVASAVRCYVGYKSVPMFKQPLCSVLEDDFSSMDTEIWAHENLVTGFGSGEFDITTDSSNNSFIKNGQLHILPTLTEDVIGSAAVMNGYTYNLTGCTGANYTVCSAVSNASTGAVVPPIMSARLSTKNSTSIKYGRVEVRAKIPRGDWIWPSIRMLPVDEVYGQGVLSGEIDIMQARGNGPSYPKQGTDYVRGSLRWSPVSWLDLAYRTFGYWTVRHSSYDRDFHTYALEWTADWLRVYVDSRLHHMYSVKFDRPFSDRTQLPSTVTTPNGTGPIVTPNPWAAAADRNAAPFDQRFYLELDVAVGGTDGWFPDGAGGKPWLDKSGDPMRDFAAAQSMWYTTWPSGDSIDDRALIIDSVKMYSYCSA